MYHLAVYFYCPREVGRSAVSLRIEVVAPAPYSLAYGYARRYKIHPFEYAVAPLLCYYSCGYKAEYQAPVYSKASLMDVKYADGVIFIAVPLEETVVKACADYSYRYHP